MPDLAADGARLTRREFSTPVGPLIAVADRSALFALEFSIGDRHDRLDARLSRWCQIADIAAGTTPVLDATAAWLAAYFAGEDANARLPLRMLGSRFERAVWERLLAIPPGQTRSYGEIASELGLRNGARAVGLANGANPLAIIVPCHRVIGSDGSLTGYGGGLERKQWLLDHERRWSGVSKLPF